MSVPVGALPLGTFFPTFLYISLLEGTIVSSALALAAAKRCLTVQRRFRTGCEFKEGVHGLMHSQAFVGNALLSALELPSSGVAFLFLSAGLGTASRMVSVAMVPSSFVTWMM